MLSYHFSNIARDFYGWFIALVKTEIPQQILDVFPLNLEQMFMVPRG